MHYGYFINVCSLRPVHLEDNEQPGEVIYVSNLSILERYKKIIVCGQPGLHGKLHALLGYRVNVLRKK